MVRTSACAFCAMAVACTLSAQQFAVNGPVEGFIFDAPTHSLRAVIGIPGSATFGPAILQGFDLGSVAPGKAYAVACHEEQCSVLSGLDSAQPSASLISSLAGRPDRVAWSADGSLAILYSRSGNWMQTLAGFPGAPQAGMETDLSPLGGALSAVAADSQGQRIAVAMRGAASGVYLMNRGQSFVPVLRLAGSAALAFSADGRSLYALDDATNQLVVLNLQTLSWENLPLEGLSDPVAVQSGENAGDPQIVYVASGSDRLIRTIDLSTKQVLMDTRLNAAPTGIEPLGRTSFAIRLRGRGEPLWLFSSNPKPAEYFVPAARGGAGGLR